MNKKEIQMAKKGWKIMIWLILSSIIVGMTIGFAIWG